MDQFAILPIVNESSLFSNISCRIYCQLFCWFCHSDWDKMKSQSYLISIFLIAGDGEQFFEVFFRHFYFFFWDLCSDVKPIANGSFVNLNFWIIIRYINLYSPLKCKSIHSPSTDQKTKDGKKTLNNVFITAILYASIETSSWAN